MNYEIDPNCPECHGCGHVAIDEAHPFHQIPCGACLRRFAATHCARCDARLPAVPWVAEWTVRGQVCRSERLCSEACATARRIEHGVVEVIRPEDAR